MLKFKEISVPIYNYPVEFISGDPFETIQYINDFYKVTVDWNEGWAACCWSFKDRSVIWFEEDTVTLPMLIHEMAHATFDMMITRGLELSDQEVFCYTQEYILEELLKCTKFTQTGLISLLSNQEDMQQ